jgi:hypothetical protein
MAALSSLVSAPLGESDMLAASAIVVASVVAALSSPGPPSFPAVSEAPSVGGAPLSVLPEVLPLPLEPLLPLLDPPLPDPLPLLPSPEPASLGLPELLPQPPTRAGNMATIAANHAHRSRRVSPILPWSMRVPLREEGVAEATCTNLVDWSHETVAHPAVRYRLGAFRDP